VGASLRGLKAMTATSGPGWALMVETVQYALMTETPVVVAMVQRLGPSTGGATQGAQGDIWLTEFSVSGGYSLPVFSPSTAAECFDLTVHAFNWSERLRTPVVLLSDKEVGMTAEVVDEASLATPEIVDRTSYAGGQSFVAYGFERTDQVPVFAALGGEAKVTATGSAHDQQGRLLKNSPEVLEVLAHLQQKIDAHAQEMELVRSSLDPGATSLLISYGITARAARQAVKLLRRQGMRKSYLQPLTLFPVPEGAIKLALEGVRTVVVAEENLSGQYRAVLAPQLEGRQVLGINKIGGLISPGEIIHRICALEA
jgi:2-oxoglutarate ferredoxin oxidoreductase subunit alpha